MKPHIFQSDPCLAARCDLCGHIEDHPIHELDGAAIGDAEDDFTREDERRDDELTGDLRDFTPPDEPDSGFDVREPETVSDLFRGYTGRDLQ